MNYKLLNSIFPIVSWSPCSTCISFVRDYTKIVIVDQHHGHLRNRNNHKIGWSAHSWGISDLNFSPNRSILFSAGLESIVRLRNSSIGNYKQLQEWNIAEEVVQQRKFNLKQIGISISFCSKYIVASLKNCLVIKDVLDDRTIKLLMLPGHVIMRQFMFSNDYRTILIGLQ